RRRTRGVSPAGKVPWAELLAAAARRHPIMVAPRRSSSACLWLRGDEGVGQRVDAGEVAGQVRAQPVTGRERGRRVVGDLCPPVVGPYEDLEGQVERGHR